MYNYNQKPGSPPGLAAGARALAEPSSPRPAGNGLHTARYRVMKHRQHSGECVGTAKYRRAARGFMTSHKSGLTDKPNVAMASWRFLGNPTQLLSLNIHFPLLQLDSPSESFFHPGSPRSLPRRAMFFRALPIRHPCARF